MLRVLATAGMSARACESPAAAALQLWMLGHACGCRPEFGAYGRSSRQYSGVRLKPNALSNLKPGIDC